MRNFCILSLILMPAVAYSGEIVAAGARFPKLFEQNETGEFTGIGPSVLKKIEKETGYKILFKEYPWKRAQMLVEIGEADLLVGAYRTREREKKYDFLEIPIYRDDIVFYQRRGDGFRWSGGFDFKSLRGKTVIAIAGWAYGDSFDREKEKLSIQMASGVESGFRMLQARRGDLLLINLREAKSFLRTASDIDALVEVTPPITSMNGGLAFSKRRDYTREKAEFMRVLRKMIDSGELKALNLKAGLRYSPR